MPSKDATNGRMRVPEVKVHATALPVFSFLLAEQPETAILARNRVIPLKVPRPLAETAGPAGPKGAQVLT